MAEDSRAKSITASNGIGSWHPLVAGAIAGVFSKTILQPLDLVKTRLQVQEVKKGAIQASESAQTAYRGVVHGLSTIIKFEGVSALYTGLAPNLLGSGMAWGCYFFVYTNAKQMLMTATSKEKLGPSEHLQCAAVSGVFTTIITNPIWLIKTRMQTQQSQREYSSAFHCLRSIVKNEGFIGLYRGIVPGLWLVSNGAIQFMAYEQLRTWTIKYIANNQESNLSSPHFFVMGACSKMFSTAITYPLQVTKARLYTKEPGSSKPRYKSVLDVWKRTISGEGIRGFYNGLTLQLFKTAPASALTFVAYENILRFLNPDN